MARTDKGAIWLGKVLDGAVDDSNADPAFLESILQQRSASMPLSKRLDYLSGCLGRADDIAAPAELRDKVGGVKQAVAGVAYSSLDEAGADAGPVVLAGIESRTLSRKLLKFLLERVGEKRPAWASAVVLPLVESLGSKIRGRTFSSLKESDVGMVSFIVGKKTSGEKLCAQLLTEASFFLPDPAESVIMKRANGAFYEKESFLGWMLCANPIDYHSLPPDERRASPLGNVLSNTRKTEGEIQRIQETLRSSVGLALDNSMNFIDAMLRAGDEPRSRVLTWFAKILEGNENRVQTMNILPPTSHLVDVIGHVENTMLATFGGQLSQHQLFGRIKGFSSSGTNIMAMYALLRLAKPIQVEQAGSLEPYMCVREDERCAELVGKMKEDTFFGDDAAVTSAKELAKQSKAQTDFKTSVFWLTLRALHCSLIPSFKEAQGALECAGHFQYKMERAKSDDAYCHWLCSEIMFGSSDFQEHLAKFVNLGISFILNCAFPEVAQGGKLANVRVPPPTVSSEFAALPAHLADDLFEVVEFYTHNFQRRPAGLLGMMDPHLTIGFLIFIMGSGSHIRNPNLRGKASKYLNELKGNAYQETILNWPMSVENLVPSCIEVFCAVEKTKMSYYDIRFHVKYELRTPIQALFQKLLALDSHRKPLQRYTEENAEGFLKFINQLLNDSTYLLDEGIDTLIEIRRREAGGESLDELGQTGSAGLGVQRAIDEEEDRTEEGEDIYRRSRTDPKEHCKQYMKLGHRTVKTLYLMAVEAPKVLVQDEVVLQQLTQNFLDANLDRLVGAKCMELKAKSGVKDFEEYNFDPKLLLSQICTIYTVLAREEPGKTQRLVAEDGRYYKPESFKKAVRIVKRERILKAEIIKDFEEFARGLAEKEQQMQAEAEVDIPDEYLDPVMADLMTDPVMLPASKTIMDRTTIQRIIMSDDHDPYTRDPLKMEDLIPQPELKAKIEAFAKENNISLD